MSYVDDCIFISFLKKNPDFFAFDLIICIFSYLVQEFNHITVILLTWMELLQLLPEALMLKLT